jgi:hypothetical protein
MRMATALTTETPTKRGPGRPRKIAVPEQTEPTNPFENDTDEDDDTPQEDDTPAISQADLAKAIHALARGQDALINSQVRKVPFANHKPRSTFNPTGKKKRKLTRTCYQNSYFMNVALLHDEEIALLNVLQPGKYLNGLVTVRIDESGATPALNIVYRNKTVDERMALKSEFRSLREFLQMAVKTGPMQD